MRRFHNPRYAPESLERKLSPSGFATLPVAAEINIPNTQTNSTSPTTTVTYSSDTASPMASSYTQLFISTARSISDPTIPGDPTEPGDSAPVRPTVPPGDGPTPPPGDGNPPDNTPSIPGGPDDPA